MPVNKSNCGFAQGTLVMMADGSLKAIEKIQSGEMVMSFDQNDASAPLEAKQVQHSYKRLDHGILEVTTLDDNTTLRVAPGQLFINPGDDWHFATETAHIVDVDGNACKFKVDNITRGKYWIYDVTIDDHHSLIANGIRVHNFGLSDAKAAADTVSKVSDAVSKMGSGGGANTSNRGSSNSKSNTGGGRSSANGGIGGGGAEHGARGTNPAENKKKNSNGAGGTAMIGKNKKKNKANNIDKSQPSPHSAAISSLNQIRDHMNFICQLLQGTDYSKWMSYKSSAITATDDSLMLAGAYLNEVTRATMSASDKSLLMSRQGDITNAIVIIKAELSKVDTASMMPQSVVASCGIVSMFATASLTVISKYVGKTTQNANKYAYQVTNIKPMPMPAPPYVPPPAYVYGGTGATVSYTQCRNIKGTNYCYDTASGRWIKA